METKDILLLHPEDEANKNIYVFTGMYMQVYAQFVKTSRAITERITEDLDQNRRLNAIAEFTELPLEKWLQQADEFLPEWFDLKLLNYPDGMPMHDGTLRTRVRLLIERLEVANKLAVALGDVLSEFDVEITSPLDDEEYTRELKFQIGGLRKAAAILVEWKRTTMTNTTERITIKQFIERNLQADIEAKRITVSRPEFSGSLVEKIFQDGDMYRIEWLTPDDGKDGEYVNPSHFDVVPLEVHWLTPQPAAEPELPEGWRYDEYTKTYQHFEKDGYWWVNYATIESDVIRIREYWSLGDLSALQAILRHVEWRERN